MPKYSILMPVYNASSYLTPAIDSILKQDIKDFELIMVNDGSKDNSLDILLNYEAKDKRVKVINNKNQGVLKTRLELIEKATGTYSLFVDADDFVKDNWLTVIDNEIKDYEMLVFNYDNLFKDKLTTMLKLKNEVLTNKAFLSLVAKSSNLNTLWNKVYMTDILKEITTKRIFNEIKKSGFAEDLLINILYVNKIKEVKLTNESLYNYRILNETLSRNISIHRMMDVLDDATTIYKLFYIYPFEKVEDKKNVLTEFYKVVFNYLNVVSNADITKSEKINLIKDIYEKEFIIYIFSHIKKINLSKYRLLPAKMVLIHRYKSVIRYFKFFNFTKKVLKVIKWTTRKQY